MYCTATGILHSSKHSLLQHSNEYKMIPNLNQYKIVQSTCFIFWAIFVVRVNKHYEMSQHLIKTHSQVSIIHDEFVKCKSELLSVHTLNQLVKCLSYFSLNILQGLFISTLCFPDPSEINCSTSTIMSMIVPWWVCCYFHTE